jgi:uncharacterized DUF497 family protein
MVVYMVHAVFDWDETKNVLNQEKHGVDFFTAQLAFLDPMRVIAEDLEHSHTEKRYFCFGEINGAILTVRFTYRNQIIRIIGAGYWRKGKKVYEKSQKYNLS